MARRGHWTKLMIAVIGPVLIFSAAARAQSPGVPEQWMAYAQLVGHQFETWLEADDDYSNAFRQYLHDRTPNASGDPPPVTIKIRAWIGADGRVKQVEFDSLGDTNADATLHRILTGHLMTQPPPLDMQQPLRLNLHLAESAETMP